MLWIIFASQTVDIIGKFIKHIEILEKSGNIIYRQSRSFYQALQGRGVVLRRYIRYLLRIPLPHVVFGIYLSFHAAYAVFERSFLC